MFAGPSGVDLKATSAGGRAFHARRHKVTERYEYQAVEVVSQASAVWQEVKRNLRGKSCTGSRDGKDGSGQWMTNCYGHRS